MIKKHKDKNHVSILTEGKNALHEVYHSFIIIIKETIGIDGIHLKILNSVANIILNQNCRAHETIKDGAVGKSDGRAPS